MVNWLVGHGVPPAIVGMVRAVLVAAALAALEAIAAGLGNLPVHGYWVVALPAVGYGIRQLEGLLDQFKAKGPALPPGNGGT